ncbi:MAG: efflux RND transporter periplasmic adaptor subunit [Puniceicoccales bacterium]|jgi:RND family efflux transporter MFP subunit|nr:efflux RND transporter periplasmic adaptor subunit [Puniceicoccales bacterium]
MPKNQADTDAQAGATEDTELSEGAKHDSRSSGQRYSRSRGESAPVSASGVFAIVLVVALVLAAGFAVYTLLGNRLKKTNDASIASTSQSASQYLPATSASQSSSSSASSALSASQSSVVANDFAHGGTVTATGNLKARSEVTVGSEISGIISEVKADSTDYVKAGQEIALIDRSRLEQTTKNSLATLNAAKARRASDEASYIEAAAILAKNKKLFADSKGQTPSNVEMEKSQAAFDRSEAQKNAAAAAVDEAAARHALNETDLAKTIIRSPIDGVVLKRNVERGQTVAARYQAPELFLIAADLKRMKLVVNVAQADIRFVHAGQNAVFTVDAVPGRKFQAKVVKVESAAAVSDTNVVTYEAELEVPNDDLVLRAGMTAVADIATSASTAAAISTPTTSSSATTVSAPLLR